jgi:cyclic nucleotide-binding protein
MSSANMDPMAVLNRILAAAAQNLRVEKLVIQLGLDPAHLTYDAIFNRLLDIAVANINFANMLALFGAIFFVATLMVRTIVPLRIIGIFSNVFFIAYGALAGSAATFFLYLLSLPINVIRLRQMLNLVKKARISAQGDLSMDWLRPFMSPRKYRKGDVLFHKGDVAKEMFLTVTGKFLVTEIGIELPPGRMMGELGFVDPKNRRTQTVECIEDGDVLTITYEKLLELYFQNQEFGYYFLRLTTERLMQNIARLEGVIAASKAGGQATAAPVVKTAQSHRPQPVAVADAAGENPADAHQSADVPDDSSKAATT